MSHEAVSWVLRHSRSEKAVKLVAIIIAEHANGYGLNSWPSQEAIAAKAGCSRRYVRAAIRKLVGLGELKVFRAPRKGRGHRCLYSLPLVSCQISLPIPDATEGKKGRPASAKEKKRAPCFHEKGATGSQNLPEPSKPKPTTNTHTQPVCVLVGFEIFWQAYPNQVGKPAARDAWLRYVKADDRWEEVLAGIVRWQASGQWDELRYVPNPVKFLAEKRWENHPPEVKRNGANQKWGRETEKPTGAYHEPGKKYRQPIVL
jgi:hypothetical protein